MCMYVFIYAYIYIYIYICRCGAGADRAAGAERGTTMRHDTIRHMLTLEYTGRERRRGTLKVLCSY